MRNPLVRALRSPLFKKRTERKKKGKASYTRKNAVKALNADA